MIKRWDAHVLKDRRPADLKATARISFWFNQTFFDTTWFKERLETAVANLGSRYTAETHLGLPLRRSILALENEATRALRAMLSTLDGVVRQLQSTDGP